MKNKIYKLILFFLFLNTLLNAQTEDYRDVIHLKNGSQIVCKIIYYHPGKAVKIRMPDGYEQEIVEENLTKVIMAPSKGHVSEKPYNFKEKGLYVATYFNTTFGRSSDANGNEENHLGVGIQSITGWQFNRLVGAGLGIGFDNYQISGNDANVLSIFGEGRGYFSKVRKSAYYSVGAGYGFSLKQKQENFTNHRGGFFLHPALGFRFGASNYANFFMDIGARFQRIGFDQFSAFAESHYTITYQRWVLRMGVVF